MIVKQGVAFLDNLVIWMPWWSFIYYFTTVFVILAYELVTLRGRLLQSIV